MDINSPSETKIFLYYENNRQEIALAQVVEYEINDGKKPVYGFQNENFSKVLKGKKIITGTILIKKMTGDIIASILKGAQNKMSEIMVRRDTSKTKHLQAIFNLDEEFYDEELRFYEEFWDRYYNNGSDSDFLDISKFAEKNIKIELEFYAGNNKSVICAENVEFINKKGVINIMQSNIDEQYTFIANPKKVEAK